MAMRNDSPTPPGLNPLFPTSSEPPPFSSSCSAISAPGPLDPSMVHPNSAPLVEPASTPSACVVAVGSSLPAGESPFAASTGAIVTISLAKRSPPMGSMASAMACGAVVSSSKNTSNVAPPMPPLAGKHNFSLLERSTAQSSKGVRPLPCSKAIPVIFCG
ncbi:hypothetical protein SUGI_0408340 [Cryptomeria japonica]|nr:hypothetical protein SUGI_0408340 [Cryptomeria japonica]